MFAGEGARRDGGGGGGRFAAALRSVEEEDRWRGCKDASDGRRARSGAGEAARSGLRGTGLAERWAPLVEGLRTLGGGTDESAASFSNLERRLLTAGGAAVSIPSEGLSEDMMEAGQDLRDSVGL